MFDDMKKFAILVVSTAILLVFLVAHHQRDRPRNLTINISFEKEADDPLKHHKTGKSAHKRYVKPDEFLMDVLAQCHKNGISTKWNYVKPRLLCGNSTFKIVYASNPKTGSSNFKKFLIRLGGSDLDYRDMMNTQVPLKRYQYFNYMRSRKVAKGYKVGFVRNPLTRLLSAFRDKILRQQNWYLLNMQEFPTYRLAHLSDLEKFELFLDRLMYNKLDQKDDRNGVDHYSVQFDVMKVCQFPYDMLGQFEHMNRDINIIQKATNTTMFEFPLSRPRSELDTESTESLTRDFYNFIDPKLLQKVYERYYWDFEILGYPKLDDPHFPYVTK